MKSKKIEDCKTLLEFFDVYKGDYIWIDGRGFKVEANCIYSDNTSTIEDGKALLGCITGQLEWSKKEPIKMTEEEEKLLHELAAWFPWWKAMRLNLSEEISVNVTASWQYPFRIRGETSSKAYEVLAPILQKHGEINLDDYR